MVAGGCQANNPDQQANKQPDKQPEVQQPTSMQIGLVDLEDNGQSGEQIGCGDSLVFVEETLPPNEDQVETALETLLANNQQFYGTSGFYDALAPSTLQIDQIQVQAGVINVYLSGTMVLNGVCDHPRIKAQLVRTVEENDPSNMTAAIHINNQTLDDFLSLQ